MIFNKINHLPYVYLIGWTSLDKWYYGVRYAMDCHPDDLWKTYFTSSKYVHAFCDNNGSPNVIQIRKTFNSITEAKLWEVKVLRRMKVVLHEKWLNKNDRHAPPIMLGVNHPMKRPEVARKYGDTMLRVWAEMSDEIRLQHKEKVSAASTKYWNSLTEEEFNRISKLRSEIQLLKEANKTPDQKKEISKKQSHSAKLLWEYRTQEEKDQHKLSVTQVANIRVSCLGCRQVSTPTALTRFHKECKNDF